MLQERNDENLCWSSVKDGNDMYNHGDIEVIKWTEEFYQECCLL